MELPRQRLFAYRHVAYIFVLLGIVTVIFLLVNRLNPQSSNVSSFITANGTKFKFPCVISQPEAISSIQRANSDECKIEIANTACKSVHGRLFPESITHRCPAGNHMPHRLLGCFPYEPSLFSSINNRSSENTPKSCVDMCMMLDFRYAGVVHGDLCYCGDTEPQVSQLETSLKCNKPCSGNSKQKCGGALHVSMYETGLAKHPTDPIKLEPTFGEKPARIAFLLMFHKRSLRQIRRLLGAIYDRHHYYYIHVDARQDYLYREMLDLEKDFPNILVARQRYSLVWGCDSQLQVMRQCIEAVLAVPSWQLDFIINISESDFPLKSVIKLTKYLTANRGRNFLLKQKVLATDKYLPATGLDRNFVECSGRMWDIGKRTLPKGITYHGGSDWFCFSREFAKYVTDGKDDLVVDLQSLFKYSGFGTESFFHTLLHNSRFCRTHYDSNLRLVSWKSGQGCSESKTIDWTGCSPVSIRNVDWSLLMLAVTDDIFFARKFNSIFDQTIVLKLEEKIFGKYPSNTPNLNSYWENVYHHHDHENETKPGALAKITYSLITSLEGEHRFHHYEPLNVLEITHYFNRNSFYGILIRHEALINDDIMEFEVLVKTRNMFKRIRNPTIQLNDKLLNIHVTNNVDKSEFLPTDFDQVLSVDQAPILVVHLSTVKSQLTVNHTVRVDWINPHRDVISVEEFIVTENDMRSNIHLFESQMKPPLTEGAWEAKVFFNESAVGTVGFLLTSNEPIPPCHVCTKCPDSGFSGLIENQCKISDRALYFKSLPHPRASIKRFFEIENVCVVHRTSVENPSKTELFQNCDEAEWSSLAPDPKSDIHYLIKRTPLN